MKNFVFTVFIMFLNVFVAYGQSNYKCNCKLVYGNKMKPTRITYFNDSLVMNELGYGAKDSTINLLFNPSGKLEELYFKVNYRWRAADTFLILNNVIGSRIGNYFYPYFPPDTMKKGEKFVRFRKYSDEINAFVFYKLGDTIFDGKQIAYFNDEFWPLINRTSIEDVIKRDLNSLPFIKNDTSYLYDSIDYFREQEICSNPDPNDPGCIFCLYIRFAKGEIPYKKEKKYDVIFLEGDCETFLKGKPTFLKEIK